jgi:prepilin-type N-terminal cleavage/methylation domain-containing protein
MKIKRNKQSGFSLVELLIVVAVIMVISAIAIPSIIASGQAGRESAAVSNLKTIVTAEAQYHQLTDAYAPTAASLSMAGANCPQQPDLTLGACFVPTDLTNKFSGGVVNGYTFQLTTSGTSWSATATPDNNGGRKSYFVDATGTIKWNATTAGATASDKALGTT